MGKRALALLLALALVSLPLGLWGISAVPTVAAASVSTYCVSPYGSDNVGSGTQESPWRTMSYAVSRASAGDIIKVMDDDNEATDDYVENVGVDKGLTIERYDNNGASPQVKALDASKPAFDLSADNVTLRGLDVSGVSLSNSSGIRLVFCSGCTVEGNRLGCNSNHDTGGGIAISGGRDNLISGNTCRYFNLWGVLVDGGNYNTISNNTFSDSLYSQGVAVWISKGTSNVIVGNAVSRNKCAGIGVNSADNVIYLNRLGDNLSGSISQTSTGANTWHSLGKMIYTYNSGSYIGYLGNYYGDYVGVDDGSEGRTAGDGVGDTNLPYSSYSASDDYPLAAGSAGAYSVIGEAPPPPVAGFSASATWGVAPLTTLFTDESRGDEITSWQWDFGDGQSSLERNPSHIYGTPGAYTVSLTVENIDGSGFVTKEDHILVIDALACQAVSPDTDCTVETPEGTITLMFPAGAVSGDTGVIIRRLSKDEIPPVRSGYRFGDTCFSVEGVGQIDKEVTIRIEYTDADLAAAGGDPNKLTLSYYDEALQEWVIVDMTLDTSAQTLTASTSHLSRWAVMSEHTSGFPLWGGVLAGIAGMLAIVVIAVVLRCRFAKRQAGETKLG